MSRLGLVGILACFALWWAIAALRLVSPLLVPSPSAVWGALFTFATGPDSLWRDLAVTLGRTLSAFVLSAVIGVPVGLLMGAFRPIHAALAFVVDFLRSIPPIALFPVMFLLLGIGDTARVGVAVYGCSLVLIVNSAYGVAHSPPLRRSMARVYGFRRERVFWEVTVPDALPHVFVGLRTALSLALVLTVVVEMILGSSGGLGDRIYSLHLTFDSPRMYACIIVTGCLGYVLNQLFLLWERRVVHWVSR